MHLAIDKEIVGQAVNDGLVLGHCIAYGDDIINMNDKESFQKLIDIVHYHGFPQSNTLTKDGQEWTVKDEVKRMFYDLPNCGDNENSYETALVSDNPQLRALVAANGKHLKELATDQDILVRQQVTKYLIKMLDGSDSEELSPEHKEILSTLLGAEMKNVNSLLAH